MGRLTTPGYLCSGNLIGPRHVAAARHCHISDVPYYFAPAYNGREVLPGAQVEAVVLPAAPLSEGACGESAEWAAFVLNERLEERLGYLGADVIDDAHRGKPLFYNYGYPGDLDGASRPYRQQSIAVHRDTRCDATGPLDTDADMSQGQSGGSLWLEEGGNHWQYGVFSLLWFMNGVYYMTSFAGGDGFVAGVVHARETWP
ncbi:trypsin-like cysteine/serine peptidase domain-containing protein [Apiospora phragmitis]|uniref:Trypsin-like cysteine/serine peptidase domain-containing protein n=1 Tax=Apiospora phragmitis TaxID=2905665 RepID=A0ABR1T9P5_9PEZI